MSKAVCKRHMARQVRLLAGITIPQAQIAVDAIFVTIIEALQAGKKVNVHNFGRFEAVLKRGGLCNLPGKYMGWAIPDKLQAKFYPSDKLDLDGSNK